MLSRRFLSFLGKKRSIVKLLLGLVIIGIVFIFATSGYHQPEPGVKGVVEDGTPLRGKPVAVVERKMLNANEDSLESLRAPTTQASRLAGQPAAPIAADSLGWNRPTGKNKNGSDTREGWPARENEERPDNPANNQVDANMQKTSPSTSSTSSSTALSPSSKHSAEYYDDYQDVVDKKAEQMKEQQKMLKPIPAVKKTQVDKKENISKRNHSDTKPTVQSKLREKLITVAPLSSKMRKAVYTKRAKSKQWETYDYENPNNLLQIHVDRAPEHSEGVGLPWPMPQSYLTEHTYHVIDVTNFQIRSPGKSCARVDKAIARYVGHINSKIDLYVPEDETLRNSASASIRHLTVSLSRDCTDNELPHEHMSEQYKLTITANGAELSAQEPWGVIRGLETFSQLIYYHKGNAVINTTHIKDYPRFSFRGLMVDTARHYLPVKYLKRVMDAMSYNKLNVLHWHMVDDQSFPFVSKTFPNLSKLGAYSASQIYSHTDIQRLIEYAADRAIRIVPEFDSPGHTRSWGLGYPRLLTNCSADYFPFGAINPISDYTYSFMTRFWSEVHDLFPDSTVHVGGDEINYKCWLRVKAIREFMLANNMTAEQYDYITLDGDKLQGYYLKHLLDVMPKDRKKIAWEEAFNSAVQWNVSTDELIINVWKGGDYEWQYTMENVIRHGYKAILSAPWYLNYISYGRDWTKYYEQDPHSFLTYAGGADTYKDQVIGGQVCVWAEFIDEANIESVLWPRASAPAEKLWSSSMMNNWKAAEVRFENHRCRMSRRGIKTQPNSGPGSCKGRMRIKPPYDANPNFF